MLLEDYRDLRGSYDKLVSIEMIEAVGWEYLPTYFRCCSELLAHDGAMLLQAIMIDDRAYEVEKAGRSFINTYIFPGGCLPSIEAISRSLSRSTDLRQVHLEDITAHYATTLEHWRERFAAGSHRLAEMGYDERFRRLWELVPELLRGRFPRAPDPGRADAARKARLPGRAAARDRRRSIARPRRRVSVACAGNLPCAMRRELYEDIHEDFRASFRTFLEREVVGEEGRYGEWERAGIVPREVFELAGARRLPGMAVPEQYGGAGAEDFRLNMVIGEETQRAAVGSFGLGITLHNDICLPYFLTLLRRGAARALAAGDRVGRADHRRSR